MNVHGVDKIIGTDQYHITAECSYSSKVDLSSELLKMMQRRKPSCRRSQVFLMKRPVGAHSVTEYKDVFLWFQTESAHAQDKVDGDKGLCL